MSSLATANATINGDINDHGNSTLRKREVGNGVTEGDHDEETTPSNSTVHVQEKPTMPASRQQSHHAAGFTIPPLRKTFTELFSPERKVGRSPTTMQSLKAVFFASWLNILLICVPISFALHFAIDNDLAIFLVSFFAIIPLAKLLGFATEEAALRVGQSLGGLLNATLGNAVELIVAILALVKCEIEVVQSSLLGSILSNLLLVLGCCFFVGGLRYSEQGFSDAASQVNQSLLAIAVFAILIPSGFHFALDNTLDDVTERNDVLAMSRGLAVILLSIYVVFILFQLVTHPHIYAEEGSGMPNEEGLRGIKNHRMFKPSASAGHSKVARNRLEKQQALHAAEDAEAGHEEEEEEVPQLNIPVLICLLIAVTVLVGFVAEWLVSALGGFTETSGVSTFWTGLILLPIVGNAAEHVTAVTVAYKDKLDLAIGVAVGSSIQIALFVIPLLVIIAWGLDKPLSLLFDPFQSVVLFLTVLLANYTTADGRANFLEGYILISVYIMVAVSAWYYPSNAGASGLYTCNQ